MRQFAYNVGEVAVPVVPVLVPVPVPTKALFNVGVLALIPNLVSMAITLSFWFPSTTARLGLLRLDRLVG